MFLINYLNKILYAVDILNVYIVYEYIAGSSPKFPLQFNGFSTGLGSKISVSNTAIANDSTIFDGKLI